MVLCNFDLQWNSHRTMAITLVLYRILWYYTENLRRKTHGRLPKTMKLDLKWGKKLWSYIKTIEQIYCFITVIYHGKKNTVLLTILRYYTEN